MIKLKDILLNEWADEINSSNDKIAYWKDSDALPFIITKDFLHMDYLAFGNPRETHAQMKHFRNESGLIMGRLWMDKKIISFWEYPENKKSLNIMINTINNSETAKNFGFKIDSSWKIDIPVSPHDLTGTAYVYYRPDVISVLVPIDKFNVNMLKNSKEKMKLLKKYQLSESIEPSATNYARAAIRDIFIQMTTRSVSVENWKGFKNFIIGNYGKKAYIEAIKDLKKDGWLTIKDGWYQWKKEYGPVNAVIEYTSPAYSGMETLSIERPEQYLPKNLKIKYKHPNDEPSYDAYRNKKS
jgi:hypothetical protein